MRDATATFRGHPSSVPQARRWADATLREWGLQGTGWSAVQIVSELATNCTLHARSDFTLRVLLDRTCLRIEVEDRSLVRLQSRACSSTSTTGRGLAIVDVLSVEWGVTSSARGKTVWALVAVDESDLVPAEDDVDGDGVLVGERGTGVPAAAGSPQVRGGKTAA